MAEQKVITSVCDSCFAEEAVPLPKRGGWASSVTFLPPGWLHVTARSATREVFAVDLCPVCSAPAVRMGEEQAERALAAAAS